MTFIRSPSQRAAPHCGKWQTSILSGVIKSGDQGGGHLLKVMKSPLECIATRLLSVSSIQFGGEQENGRGQQRKWQPHVYCERVVVFFGNNLMTVKINKIE